MEIHNQKITSRAKLWLIRMPLLVVLLVLVLTLMDIIPTALWLIVSAAVFVITLLFVLIGRLHYVYFSFSQREIILRHYHLFPLITDYQEFSVQISDNPEFEINYRFFNLIPILHITIRTSQGRAVYPPIPLGLLPKNDLEKLKNQLGI